MGSAPSSHVCATCKEKDTFSLAQHYCVTCKIYLCKKCRGNHNEMTEGTIRFPRSKTTLMGSDEVNDCDICSEEGKNLEANYYCSTCPKYLCTACRLKHKKQSTDHKIQDLSGASEEQKHKIIDLLTAATTSSETTELLNIRVMHEFTKKVNVQLPDDRSIPRITGCAFLERGELIVCDHANCKVLLLNSDLKSEVDYRRFHTRRPWDVSAINKSAVVVTFPADRCMRYIQVYPIFSDIHTIVFDRKCFGVTVAANKIYVTCHSETFSFGDVRQLDIDGNQLKIILFEAFTPRALFQWPYYIAADKDGRKLYVSDWKAKKVTSIFLDGNINFQFSSNVLEGLVGLGLENAAGIQVDSDGNAVVCDCGGNSIVIITATGKKHRTLLKSNDGLNKPYSLVFRSSDGLLIVGSENSELLIFKLA